MAAHNLVEPVAAFVGANPGPMFTLLGALIALLTASFVHFDRVRRERNDRIRNLLGEYVAAVHGVEDSQRILATRQAERRSQGFDPMEFVRSVKGQPEDPVRAAMTAKVREAREDLQRARSGVRSLFFQLSIVKGKGEDDLIFAIKLLDAAATEPEYINAYNFTLAVGMHYYGDSRHERRSGGRTLRANRPIATAQWERHTAAQEEEDEDSAIGSPAAALAMPPPRDDSPRDSPS